MCFVSAGTRSPVRGGIVRCIGRCTVVALDVSVVSINICFFGFPGGFIFNNIANVTTLTTGLAPLSTSTFSSTTGVVLLKINLVFLNGGFTVAANCTAIIVSLRLVILRGVYPLHNPLDSRPVLSLLFTVTLPTVTSTLLFGINTSSNNASIVTLVIRGCARVRGITITLFLASLFVIVTTYFIFSLCATLCSFINLAIGSLIVSTILRGVGVYGTVLVIYSSEGPVYSFIVHGLIHNTACAPYFNTCASGPRCVVCAALAHHRTSRLRSFVRGRRLGTFVSVLDAARIFNGNFGRTWKKACNANQSRRQFSKYKRSGIPTRVYYMSSHAKTSYLRSKG